MIDLGSGAGFPAVIIKILKPDLDVTLVESNGKKASFLKYAIHILKLTGIIPINGRIEKITEDIKALGFDMITSRAMTNLENIVRISDFITYRLPGKKAERTTVIIQKESISDN